MLAISHSAKNPSELVLLTAVLEHLSLLEPSEEVLCSLHRFPCVCVQEDEMNRQTALRLISVIGYSLSLSSLTLATLLMGMLRSVADSHADKSVLFVWR